MTDVEMILEMAEMQKKLDKALLTKGRSLGKINGFNLERTTLALIDEIGELVHELKGDWCWWKSTQAPVNYDKVLEELVDLFHFSLSIDTNSEKYVLNDKLKLSKPRSAYKTNLISFIIQNAIEGNNVTVWVYKLMLSLGFTMEEVYNGYIEKNKENYERIANGY